jgi:hypothetical protein
MSFAASKTFIIANVTAQPCDTEARAFATVVVAGFRGFLHDLCTSRDRQPVDRAVETWLQSLDMIPHNNAPLQKVSRDK